MSSGARLLVDGLDLQRVGRLVRDWGLSAIVESGSAGVAAMASAQQSTMQGLE